jgi:hypothetical protein
MVNRRRAGLFGSLSWARISNSGTSFSGSEAGHIEFPFARVKYHRKHGGARPGGKPVHLKKEENPMKPTTLNTIALLGAALTAGSATGSWAQTGVGELNPQTEVRLHVVDRLQSGVSRAGDRINFRVDADVQDAAGNVLIRGGTPAYGTITQSKGSGAWGRRGHLDMSIDYTTAVDGQRVPLRGQNVTGGRKGGTTAWATAMIVAPVAGFFMKGGNVTIEAGTPLIAFVDSTLQVGAPPRPVGGSMGLGTMPTAASVSSGPAKSVVLRNGDKITGSVEALANGVYTIATSMGRLQIAASDIKEIRDLNAAPAAPVTMVVAKTRRGR